MTEPLLETRGGKIPRERAGFYSAQHANVLRGTPQVGLPVHTYLTAQ